MARGVDFPLRLTARGGLRASEANVANIVAVEILPSRSSNPFDERDGVTSDDFAFASLDERTEGSIRRHIGVVFARREQEGRARLIGVTFDHEGAQTTGRLLVLIEWENLETGESESTIIDPSGGV